MDDERWDGGSVYTTSTDARRRQDTEVLKGMLYNLPRQLNAFANDQECQEGSANVEDIYFVIRQVEQLFFALDRLEALAEANHKSLSEGFFGFKLIRLTGKVDFSTGHNKSTQLQAATEVVQHGVAA
ncbi:hypothetical protein CKO36_08170 [Rhabdochromatium marinum]|nr:hypothetical protein [Rhabdochromatium marinum]